MTSSAQNAIQNLTPTTPQSMFTRYIFTIEHFSEIAKEIYYGAFMPDTTNEVSVYKIDKLTPTEIWDIVRKGSFGKKKKQNLKARGDIEAKNVTIDSLHLVPNTTGLHANIAGWPPSSDRVRQVNYATLLASKATLHTL
jgi:hypothetical protein